jgi:hypothetical protein
MFWPDGGRTPSDIAGTNDARLPVSALQRAQEIEEEGVLWDADLVERYRLAIERFVEEWRPGRA